MLHLCREAGLVKLGHVAVDSTKVRANASKHKAMSFARMKEEEKKLQAEIRSWFEECAEVDAAEDALYGLDKTGDEWPAELADPKRRLHKIQEAKAALTDPDSRIMLSSDNSSLQLPRGGGCRFAGDPLAQVSQTAADQGQLLPLVEQVDQGVAPQMVSADAGYWKESDVELLEINDIEPFVAPKRVSTRSGGSEPDGCRPGTTAASGGAGDARPGGGPTDGECRRRVLERVGCRTVGNQ